MVVAATLLHGADIALITPLLSSALLYTRPPQASDSEWHLRQALDVGQ
jgi:hypothetical protein